MAEGDIDLGAFLDKYSPTPAPKPESELPEIKATRQTYYYPATPEATRAAGLSYGMEGGIKGGPGFSDVDLREHTIEKFKEGKSPYVAVAMAGKPTGELFRSIVEGTPIIGKWVDTGGGLRPGQQDIATSNPDLARGGGTGGGAPEYPGISPMMQIAMEKPAARPEEPQAQPQRTPGAAMPSTPSVPNFMTPTVMPQVQPYETPPIQMGIGQAIQQTPIPQTQPQNIDLGAFLASRMTPTPAPAETPAPAAQDIDLGQFLASRVSAQELPQALSGAVEPSIPRGIAQGLGDLLPRSIGQAVGMVLQSPVTETPHAFKEAYDVMRGVPVEQAVPESQAYVGKNKEELARTITGQAAQIGMGAAGLKFALKPRARAGPTTVTKTTPTGRMSITSSKPLPEVTEDNWPQALDYVKSKYGGTQPLRDAFNQWIDSEGIKFKDPQMRAGQMQEFVRKIIEEPEDVEAFLPKSLKTEPDVVPTVSGGKAVAKPAAAEPVAGDLWYQGVSSEGKTQWVTHDPKIAANYAKRRGAGAKVNVYTAEQVGATAFADQEGNPMSPQEFAKHNWSTTLQTQGGPEGAAPVPIRTMSIAEAEAAAKPAAGAGDLASVTASLSKEFTPAVQLPSGEIKTYGKENHNVIRDQHNLGGLGTNGYVDKAGNFHTLLDVARVIERKMGGAAAKPAAAETAPRKATQSTGPPTTPPGGNGPPSEINRESGEPMPEHPESGALAEASKGNMFSRVARAFRSFRDTFTIEPLPNLRRAGLRDSGYAHASSRNAIMPVVRDMLSRVFPEQYKDPVAMKITGDVLVKDNVLGIYDQIKAQLMRDDLSVKERTRLTQNMADLEGSIAQYDADVRAAMQDPMTAANVARWKEWVNPEMERMYRELRNEDPNAEPDPRGRYTGARVNLLPMFKAESLVDMLDHTKTMPEPSYSNYRNPNVKADPFARHAKGTGEYSNDPMLMLINSLGQRYVETTKLAFYKDIVANGQGIITEPGTHIGNKDLTRMPARMPETNPETGKVRTVEKTLWVNKQIADEVRQVLNVDKLGGGNPLFQWATALQLMQGIDMTAHLKNIHTVIANSLGQSAMGDLARRFPGISSADAVARMTAVTKEVMADTPEIRAEIADMARRGEIRPKYPSTGISKITKGQEIIHEADTAARIIMKRFWENNVRRGRVVDNVDARRQFINQIGEYNQRVMNDYQRRVRNMGLSPFVVAGRSFNAFSRRLIFGSIGFKPANIGQAILLRSLNLTSLAVTASTVAAFNYAITGKPGGRAGVPIGAIDTGKNDEKGRPIVVDVFQLIGIRRGLRATGTGAVIEGMRKGQTAREIGTQARWDIGSTALGPWIGPGLHALFGALWGKRLDLRSGDMYQIGRKLKPGQGIQELESLRATLRDTNPLIYSIISPVFGEAQNKEDVDRNWGSRLYQGAITPMERSVGVRPMTKQEMTGTPYEKKHSGTPVYIGR